MVKSALRKIKQGDETGHQRGSKKSERKSIPGRGTAMVKGWRQDQVGMWKEYNEASEGERGRR